MMKNIRRNPREAPLDIARGNFLRRSMDRSQSRYLQTSTFLTILLLFCSASFSVQEAEPEMNEEVTFTNGEVTLAGTLSLPPSSGRHPAVFFVSGSGPQDRDGATGAIPGYEPFAAIAEHLARNGIAVLRYDDRGVGESSGDYGTATEPDFVNDARTALEFLLARSDIDAKRVGIVGQSEGGMIAAMIAAADSRPAFVISLAGPAVKGDELLLRQAERAAQAEGMNPSMVAEVAREQRRILELALEKNWKELKAVVHAATVRRLDTLPEEKKVLIGDIKAFADRKAAQSLRTFQHPRYQFILAHDTAEDWAKVKIPVLAVFGELDVQCDAAQNTAGLRQALARGGNDNLTVKVIPSANHLLVEAKTGSMREYATLPKDLAPGLLEIITQWVKETAESIND
jgi:pimeloyl-ACP methyl ester carboxylesterase